MCCPVNLEKRGAEAPETSALGRLRQEKTSTMLKPALQGQLALLLSRLGQAVIKMYPSAFE